MRALLCLLLALPSQAAPHLARARAEVAPLFRGADLGRHQGPEPKAQLAAAVAEAKALPAHGVVLLQSPSAAGKSTLAGELVSALDGRARIFSLDRYFKDLPELPMGVDGKPDFDRPDSLYLGLAARHIRELLEGKAIELPRRDWPTARTYLKSGEFMTLGPGDVLIVDSIYASHPVILEAIQGRPSMSVHVAAPTTVRLARRLKRDLVERGASLEKNLGWFGNILHDEDQFVHPLKENAGRELNLVGAEELAKLEETYAGLLAQLWEEKGGPDETATALFKDRLSRSIAADAAPRVELPLDGRKVAEGIGRELERRKTPLTLRIDRRENFIRSAAMFAGPQRRPFVTGRYKDGEVEMAWRPGSERARALYDWMRVQPGRSITPESLFVKALALEDGDVWRALALGWSVLTIGRASGVRERNHLRKTLSLAELRGDDNFSAWYRFWGAMMHSYFRGSAFVLLRLPSPWVVGFMALLQGVVRLDMQGALAGRELAAKVKALAAERR